ncbi:hypothetical protein PG990_015454 [Apiospora arundinis]|uniref:Uncharacterized protein n=1 Tax=Apiospora arundinis TaxID=335852 RepID=A0ABR2HNV3_9PEZI
MASVEIAVAGADMVFPTTQPGVEGRVDMWCAPLKKLLSIPRSPHSHNIILGCLNGLLGSDMGILDDITLDAHHFLPPAIHNDHGIRGVLDGADMAAVLG